jgi:hypothetical protein
MNLVKSRHNESIVLRHFSLGDLGLGQDDGAHAVTVLSEAARATCTQSPLLDPGLGMIWSFMAGSPWKKDMSAFLVHDEGGHVIVPHEFAPGTIPLNCVFGETQTWSLEEDTTPVVRPPDRLIQTAGVWVHDEVTRRHAEECCRQEQRDEYMVNCARRACQCFSAWLNGDVWRYSVRAYQHVAGWGTQNYLNIEPMVDEECDNVFGFDLPQELCDVVEQVAHEAGRILAGRYPATGLVVSKDPSEQFRKKFRVVSN